MISGCLPWNSPDAQEKDIRDCSWYAQPVYKSKYVVFSGGEPDFKPGSYFSAEEMRCSLRLCVWPDGMVFKYGGKLWRIVMRKNKVGAPLQRLVAVE